jgi:hypothetical protein
MKRGHGIIGADLPDLYMMSGAKVQQISDTSPSAFMYALTYSTPSIIHVVSSFQESPRTGEIYLDLGALGFEGKPIDDDVLVTAGLIDSLMRKTIRDDVPPFMIVEGIVPPDSYDRARQAVLRNAFCSQLFRLGRARGVLGTGLYEPTSLLQSLQVIVNALNARETIGKLHRDLWILGNHVVPPALFTSDPELPVIW